MLRHIHEPKNTLDQAAAQAKVMFQQALALQQNGQLTQAQVLYEEILKIQPNHHDVLHLLGVIAYQTNHLEKAVEWMDKAIALKPKFAEAYNNRGIALKLLKKFDAALGSYDQAIALKPNYADAHFNRGIALKELKQFDAAVASYDTAIAIQPDNVEAYANRGIALQELKRLEAALASYEHAIALKPDYAEGHWNKSILLLLLGDFDRGWEEYEWRWRNENLALQKRNFAQPLWLGKESLAGKAILLYCEQGLGDTIQFCRYAKSVADLGARVVLEVQEPLLNLFASLDGVSQLVEKDSFLPALDYHCPLTSLPLAFRTNIDSIPSSIPYLSSDAERIAKWQDRLGEKTKPRVGLVWSGNPQLSNDHNRSIPLSDLLNGLGNDCQYVGLQKEVRDRDKETLQSRPDIAYFGDELKDFSDTAALCELMDVVISVDTSVAHLAGALGRQVWILLPFIPDWRWLLDRSDSPWYPDARLYRQDKPGDWAGVLERVKLDLIQLSKLHHRRAKGGE